MKPLLLSLALVLTAPAAILPPTLDDSPPYAVIAPIVHGTGPFTYQWYRETGTIKKVRVKIPAPEGVQEELTLSPSSPAGIYFRETTNASGSVMSHPFKLSVTKTVSAAPIAITLKKP